MKEEILREAIRTALKEITGDSKVKQKETITPLDKEHLSNNKENLQKELFRRWGIGKITK